MPTQSTGLNDDIDGRLTSGYYENSGDGTSKWLMFSKKADGGDVALGATTQAEATGDGSAIQILKRIRTLLTNGVTRHSEVLLVSSASRSAGGTGSDVDFSTYRRGVIFIDITVASAVSINFFLQAKSTTLSKYARIKKVTLPTPGTPGTSPSYDYYINGDGSTGIGSVASFAYIWDEPLPATGRLEWAIASGSATFSAYFIGES